MVLWWFLRFYAGFRFSIFCFTSKNARALQRERKNCVSKMHKVRSQWVHCHLAVLPNLLPYRHLHSSTSRESLKRFMPPLTLLIYLSTLDPPLSPGRYSITRVISLHLAKVEINMYTTHHLFWIRYLSLEVVSWLVDVETSHYEKYIKKHISKSQKFWKKSMRTSKHYVFTHKVSRKKL
jgi:hypothetical protein